jgi:large subunit ribosomal protein L23
MIQIIKRPILTEKSEKVKGIHNHYVFEVERTANKIEFRQVIVAMFGVKVEKVRTVTVRGKRRIRYTRRGIQEGRTRSWKKAYVRLKPGYSIDVVSGEGETND